MSDVELEEIKGSPYLSIAFERGKKEGAKQELKIWETLIDDTILADECDNIKVNVDLLNIRERMQKRLKELME